MWKYDSPIGPIYIAMLNTGGYGIIFNDNVFGSWNSPQSAADDVYCHVTGCYEWDSLDGTLDDVPNDINEWDFVQSF